MLSNTDGFIISASAATTCTIYQYPAGRAALSPHKQTKDNDGLTFQTPGADICTASAEEKKSTNVPALWEH